jgi:DNA-directed RNA polymerase subunit RPC12/RpoP
MTLSWRYAVHNQQLVIYGTLKETTMLKNTPFGNCARCGVSVPHGQWHQHAAGEWGGADLCAGCYSETERPEYPPDWPDIAEQVKIAAGWRCVRCGHRHELPAQRLECTDECDLDRHPEWGASGDLNPGRRLLLRRERPQRVLTVHHIDGDKYNVEWWNLVALCQVCHLIIQAKVKIRRPWLMFAHSEWFKPYAAGWYAWRYLGENLSREPPMVIKSH